MFSYGPCHMAEQKQDDQLEPTYSSSVRIRDVALRICQKRWTIERSGERGSGIYELAERHDDDDDDETPLTKLTLSYPVHAESLGKYTYMSILLTLYLTSYGK